MHQRAMPGSDEESPLLRDEESHNDTHADKKLVELAHNEHPRSWPYRKKMTNVGIVASMAILGPLASSMFAPGIDQIAEELGASHVSIIACQTGFVCMLGIGPLILAPLSETFGRKILYTTCFTIFTLFQIPSALSPNVACLIAMRSVCGFFGSISIANGGGTISDMFEPSQRAGIFGWYLLGPLLGPSLGPPLGGIILNNVNWRWLFWILGIICIVVVAGAYLFLQESYVPALLQQRRAELEKTEGGQYYFEGEDDRPLSKKLRESIKRPLSILFKQPIVLTMATYQALVFAITYSLYTQFQRIYGGMYGFSTLQVGFVYLGTGLGFLTAVWFLVPKIDTIFNSLAKKHGKEKPEYRLPLANVGSVLIPISMFWFAWTVEYHVHWFVTILSTYFYGIGQVAIFNCVQNYYIDSFEKYAASAIAAGALFRSLVGGVVPLFTPSLLDIVGVGWGMSLFGLLGVLLAPSPWVFFRYGEWLRERFAIKL